MSVAKLTSTQCRSLEPFIKEGDLIFSRSGGILFDQVAKATDTWTTHVGIILKEGGIWLVGESKVPKSVLTEFCDFINRSYLASFSIRRLRQPISTSQLSKIKQLVDENLSILYDPWFNLDRENRQFCSKFVHQIFKDAIGVEIGKIETLQDLKVNNPKFDLKFFTAWFGGKIPWNQKTVTPKSQMLDSKIDLIIENIPQSMRSEEVSAPPDNSAD